MSLVKIFSKTIYKDYPVELVNIIEDYKYLLEIHDKKMKHAFIINKYGVSKVRIEFSWSFDKSFYIELIRTNDELETLIPMLRGKLLNGLVTDIVYNLSTGWFDWWNNYFTNTKKLIHFNFEDNGSMLIQPNNKNKYNQVFNVYKESDCFDELIHNNYSIIVKKYFNITRINLFVSTGYLTPNLHTLNMNMTMDIDNINDDDIMQFQL